MTWRLERADRRPRIAVFVSRYGHCLHDILSRWESGEWAVDIPLIVSNHADLAPVAERHGIRFEHVPVTRETKAGGGAAPARAPRARKASTSWCWPATCRSCRRSSSRRCPARIINIHHSFLPAFAGGQPYHAAHARGVKVIGATSHYVTAELDAGPIIAQDVVAVSHKDSVDDMVRKGRDLEKIVLARAVYAHLQHGPRLRQPHRRLRVGDILLFRRRVKRRMSPPHLPTHFGGSGDIRQVRRVPAARSSTRCREQPGPWSRAVTTT